MYKTINDNSKIAFTFLFHVFFAFFLSFHSLFIFFLWFEFGFLRWNINIGVFLDIMLLFLLCLSLCKSCHWSQNLTNWETSKQVFDKRAAIWITYVTFYFLFRIHDFCMCLNSHVKINHKNHYRLPYLLVLVLERYEYLTFRLLLRRPF